MLDDYRTILRIPGALAFSSVGWLGRVPMAVAGLALVLLVSEATGSYGMAGAVSASYVLVAAVAAPLQARLVDRHGQHRILPLLSLLYTGALGGVIVVVQLGVPAPLPHLLAGLAGATSPMIGSYVRARWTRMLGGKPELQTAFALEAMLDEVCFMVGPPVVTFLATAVHPVFGLLTAMACGLIGTLLLAAQRRTEPPAHGRGGDRAEKQSIGWVMIAPVAIACIGLGVLFGSVEVIVVAYTEEQHVPTLSGVLLAVWAAGSMLAALILGALKLRASPMRRFQLGTIGMAVAMLPLPFVGNLWMLGVLLFFAGFAISPTMIASIGVVEQSVPRSRLSEGIAWVTSALVGGVALGAALAGQVIDRVGASPGFFVPLGAGLLAVLAAYVGGPFYGPRQPTPVPSPAAERSRT